MNDNIQILIDDIIDFNIAHHLIYKHKPNMDNAIKLYRLKYKCLNDECDQTEHVNYCKKYSDAMLHNMYLFEKMNDQDDIKQYFHFDYVESKDLMVFYSNDTKISQCDTFDYIKPTLYVSEELEQRFLAIERVLRNDKEAHKTFKKRVLSAICMVYKNMGLKYKYIQCAINSNIFDCILSVIDNKSVH